MRRFQLEVSEKVYAQISAIAKGKEVPISAVLRAGVALAVIAESAHKKGQQLVFLGKDGEVAGKVEL